MRRSILQQFARAAENKPPVEVPAGIDRKLARTQLAQAMVNLECALSFGRGLTATVDSMRNSSANFRGSRAKAYALLSTVAAKRLGKEKQNIDLESFGVTGFVSQAVTANLEQADALVEAAPQAVQAPATDATEAINAFFLTAVNDVKTKRENFDAQLQSIRDGENKYATGLDGYRAERIISGEITEEPEGFVVGLVTTLKASKEAGKAVVFDCDQEANSVLLCSQLGFVLNSEASNFPFESYRRVREKLVGEDNLYDFLNKGVTEDELYKVYLELYEASDFAKVFTLDASGASAPRDLGILVKSYTLNPFNAILETAMQTREVLLADLDVIKHQLSTESGSTIATSAGIYLAFVGKVLKALG